MQFMYITYVRFRWNDNDWLTSVLNLTNVKDALPMQKGVLSNFPTSPHFQLINDTIPPFHAHAVMKTQLTLCHPRFKNLLSFFKISPTHFSPVRVYPSLP